MAPGRAGPPGSGAAGPAAGSVTGSLARSQCRAARGHSVPGRRPVPATDWHHLSPSHGPVTVTVQAVTVTVPAGTAVTVTMTVLVTVPGGGPPGRQAAGLRVVTVTLPGRLGGSVTRTRI